MSGSKAAKKVAMLRRGKPERRHVRIYKWELESAAYRSLDVYARALLIEFKGLYNGANNGELYMSVRDAAKRLGITSKDYAAAALQQLEDRGFIVPTRKGSRTRRAETNLATSWRLTEYDDDLTGRSATKDFMRWRPPSAPPPDDPAKRARLAERARKAARTRWAKKIEAYRHKHRGVPPQASSPPKRPARMLVTVRSSMIWMLGAYRHKVHRYIYPGTGPPTCMRRTLTPTRHPHQAIRRPPPGLVVGQEAIASKKARRRGTEAALIWAAGRKAAPNSGPGLARPGTRYACRSGSWRTRSGSARAISTRSRPASASSASGCSARRWRISGRAHQHEPFRQPRPTDLRPASETGARDRRYQGHAPAAQDRLAHLQAAVHRDRRTTRAAAAGRANNRETDAMTGISWTDATWNPWAGCAVVSPGCAHCYAMRDAWRISNHPTAAPWYRGTVRKDLGKPAVWTGAVHRADVAKFHEPLGWRTPRMVFVNSMSDFLLGEPAWRDEAVEIMRRCPQHRFQILTKRAELLHALPPLPTNVWLGVSVERQDLAWRVDRLRAIDAAIRFVSAEPLLGPLDLNLTGIGWLIVGGESGPRSRIRRFDPDWARSLRGQAAAAGVAFHVKQMGGSTRRELQAIPPDLRIRDWPEPA